MPRLLLSTCSHGPGMVLVALVVLLTSARAGECYTRVKDEKIIALSVSRPIF